ncbi:ABC transporter ATP-binding protein [Verminephrobacter aporrectodeae subsp. tuberculatae]|uniref:ABC transporter ATP-binding protein n=1 Tax=Verminephrobacter aporrectodeae TaxID=1110389 RepID=UPI002244C425|nr:ABC transporter ATP-binding protein [Verminephrobacter aporrectodeae]MCW8163482.1 ABC transporter ATP-binding protein [Verminephrobacter aporrectodeae subsp. tuberculatae]MCW8167797.1 ABC transporter ATP-binding protein [Verminephrobacter aporrectodeae subsp. tuberculatae]MCW8205776.1 ABC transporter ATP-binding protein [Verminephrobacter aporrectodeae subsp. tuberculatae]
MKPLLEVRELRTHFGGLRVTDGLNLQVHPGEIHALIGPNGAGKTTLIHQLAGTLAPTSGQILFDGHDVTALSDHARAALGITRSYQITSIFKRLSVRENIALAVQARSGHSYSFWKPLRDDHTVFDEAHAILQQIGLGAVAERRADSLAYGDQRVIEVGIALANAPRLLLLDEPMAGMGPQESQRMVSLIQSLRGRLGIVLVEHDMEAVFQLADRISVLLCGRVLASGTPDAVRHDPQVIEAYLGADSESP